jgi:very-short-patch-repair endonuclease/predicted transcriptional regulator of viral defense system
VEGVWPRTEVCVPNQAIPPIDQAIAGLAERQYNVVTARQLQALGLGARNIRVRAERGRLHTLHRSVYAVGSRNLTREGHWLAGVYACGEGSALSYRSVAAHWGMRQSAQAKIDVTSPSRAGRSCHSIRVHSGATLTAADVTVHEGIPCTTVARTLLDLADVLSFDALDRAVHEAVARRLFDLGATREALERANGRHGAQRLREVLADPGHLEGPLPHEGVEERFFAFCRQQGLPRPEVHQELATALERLEVDFLWRRQRLVVETDSRDWHSTIRTRQRDAYRDRLLEDAGYRVRRYTWAQVVYEPERLAKTLRQLLCH